MEHGSYGPVIKDKAFMVFIFIYKYILCIYLYFPSLSCNARYTFVRFGKCLENLFLNTMKEET